MILTPLRPYQIETVERALALNGFAILSEQRTGKTLASLAVVDACKPDYLIIICPKKAVLEWEQQIERHLKLDWDCEIEVIHYEGCTRTAKQRKHYRAKIRGLAKIGKTVFSICDEAHRIKRRGSYQSRLLRSIGEVATWRLLLTGTLLAQGVQDAWAPLKYIQPDAIGSLEDFEDEFVKFGGYKGKQRIGAKNEEEFAKLLHKYSYRITLNEARQESGIEAVKVKRRRVEVRLKAKSWLAYRELENKLETEIGKVRISVPKILNLTMKLQQLAGGFLIYDRKVLGKVNKVRQIIPVGEEKIEALRDLLITFENRRKLVICARFTHELKAIESVLNESDPTRTSKFVAGGIPYDNKFDTDVILLQIQAGVAIDLSASNTYIFYSWDHSYINHEQARFRVLSFNTNQVNYYYLFAKGTIDEDIYAAVTRKKDLATLICDKYRRKLDGRKSSKKHIPKLETRCNKRRVSKTYTRTS